MGRNVEEELRIRARQQAVVAELGQRALAGLDLTTLMDEAVELVAETLRVEYCKVLELLPDGEALLLRAGVGWQSGLVGQATVSAGLESQAGYTLVSHEPVIVEDLATETRFSGPPLLHDHGVVSGISVIIQGEGRPFGVMGAHTTGRRTFSQDDIHFLQAMANVLAEAIQRKRAADALRESEARFRVLAEHALAGIYLIQDGRFRYVNPALATMFGYTPEEVTGRLGPLDLTAPEDRERVAENVRRRIAGEVESLHYTFRGLRKDGTLFECEVLGAVAEYAGRPAVLGMVLDITDRKRAEEALRASEEKYRNLFEHASDSIFIIDPATRRFVDVNENAARRLGYTREELLQLTFDDIDTPMAAACNEAIIRELQETGSVVFEHAHRRKDGTEMPVEISSRIIEYGGRQVFQSFVRDITRRKLAEERQTHFQSLLEAISDVNQLIVREKDSQAMLQEACQILQRTRGYAGLWIGLLDEGGRQLRQVAGAGIAADAGLVELSLDEPAPLLYCVRTALAERRPCLIADVEQSHPCGTCPYRATVPHAGALAVPLRYRRQGCGVLVVYTERPWAFHEDETQLLSELANDLALGLHALDEEKKLLESEERFRNAFDHAAIGRAIAEPGGRFLRVNRSFCEMLGYSVDELLQKRWQDITHPADLEAGAKHARRVMAGEVPSFGFECRLVHKDGHAVWVDLNVVLVRDLEGNPLYMVGDIVDLTERKELEETLSSERDEFNFILQELPVGVTVLDSEDKYVYINPASLKIDGYKNDLDSLIGQDVRSNHPAQTLATVERILRDFKAGERSVFSREARRGRRTVAISYHALRNPEGEYQGLLRLVADITERKRAEAEIRKLSQFQESIIDNANVWLDVLDEKARVVIWNKAAEEISGYSRQEVVGHGRIWEWLYPDEDYRREVVAKAIALIKEGGEERGSETTIRCKDGQTRIISWNSRNLVGEKGNPIGSISLGRDVTERVRAEAALKEYSEHLEEMVEARTKELRDAQEQLVRQEKLAILGQLAGGVAHELRNPLGAISNAAYFLNLVLEDPEPVVKETLEILDREVRTSEKIISSLLDYARARPPLRQAVNVNALVQQALARADVPANIQVTTHLDETLPAIQADPDQLAQVFENLIRNAVQAMPEGGQLSVISEQSAVDGELTTDPWILITVKDTGVGIPPENQGKLFEPLFTTKAKGIGLGLALCKMLVEGHGGTIEVESEPGKGSTFTVKLIGD